MVWFVGRLIALILAFVWPSLGVSSQGDSLTHTLTYLHVVSLRDTCGATLAFSTNRGVHYTESSHSRHPSCKQWRAGNSELLIRTAVRFYLILSTQQECLRYFRCLCVVYGCLNAFIHVINRWNILCTFMHKTHKMCRQIHSAVI